MAHRCVKLDHVFLLSENVFRRLNQRHGFSKLQPLLLPAAQASASGERKYHDTTTKRQCSAHGGKHASVAAEREQ